jgi:predicted small secreted protein
MKRALLLAAFTAAACSNTVILGSGQFVAPTGLAVVPAADRDLIFVAGTGRDGLRALEICEGINSDDNVTNTCPEDLQFVPGPIRVFPANVETNDRPLQLAGAWLNLPVPALPDGGPAPVTPQGVVLVVGANKSVRFVDAKNLLDATAGDAGLTEPLTRPTSWRTTSTIQTTTRSSPPPPSTPSW